MRPRPRKTQVCAVGSWIAGLATVRSAIVLSCFLLSLGVTNVGQAQEGESPAAAPRVSDVVQALGLQEEIFPQDAGTAQWTFSTGVGVSGSDRALVIDGVIAAEIGVIEGLELRAIAPIEGEPSSGSGGLGSAELGALYGLIDEDEHGLSANARVVLPALSGIGEDVYAYDAELIAHHSIGPVHAQVVGGVELQHGRDLEDQRDEEVRADIEGALAVWVHLESVAIVLEGAAEPMPDRYSWSVGPSVLWQVAEPLVLGAEGQVDLGGDEIEVRGAINLIVQNEVAR
jgi:hypothetical protein